MLLKRVTISVSSEDILNGIAEDCNKCPVARALLRQLNISKVEVNSDTIVLHSPLFTFTDDQQGELDYAMGRHEYTIDAPVKVERFVEGFDEIPDFTNDLSAFFSKEAKKDIARYARSRISPFTFTIKVPAVIIPILHESETSQETASRR